MNYVPKYIVDTLKEKFAYLWEVDNEAWLDKRKSDWQYIEDYYKENNATEEELEKEKAFFIYGEYKGYISSELFFVPFDSKETLREFIFSDVYSSSERRECIGGFFDVSYNLLSHCPWKKQFNQMFVEAILGDEYQELKEPLPGGGENTISPEPSYFCSSFILTAFKIFKQKRDYHPYIEAVDYFVTALPYFTDTYWRIEKRRKQFFQMLELAESFERLGDAPPIVKELAEKVMARKQEIIDNWNVNAHLDED